MLTFSHLLDLLLYHLATQSHSTLQQSGNAHLHQHYIILLKLIITLPRCM